MLCYEFLSRRGRRVRCMLFSGANVIFVNWNDLRRR